jgi:putative PIN family toxin of toxin-antitoxin system
VGVPNIVIDTNVLIATLRSRRGASFRLLKLISTDKFEFSLSVALVLEYEAAAKRLMGEIPLDEDDIDAILDYMCKVGRHQKVSYLWRPYLKDASDDMVLELAVAAGCEGIVTYNKSDFEGVEEFGLTVETAREFLERIGELT